VSGNPAGRPKGARHAALAALDAIGAQGAEAVLRAVVKAAREGDMRAADIRLPGSGRSGRAGPWRSRCPL
jgi:hypothetical protein